ncbi:MAG TPA: PAS domain S-box protein [Nannocystis sp.]
MSTTDTDEELVTLRRRVAELEAALHAATQRVQELTESETRLQHILDGSNDGGWDWNIVTGEAFLSAGWLRIAGYGPDELPGNVDTWLGLMNPEDAPKVQQALNDFLAGKMPVYEAENRILHKSGKWVWILNRGKVVERDADGRPVRMTGTITDITKQREAEEKLRKSQALLRAVIDNSPAAISVQDLDGRYVLVNRHYALLHGLDPAEAVGDPSAGSSDSPAFLAGLREQERQQLEGGQALVAEEEFERDGEVRTFLSTRFLIHDDAGKATMLGTIATDISDRKRAEEERVALQRRIIETQQATLRELSTPLLPIAEGVLVMPLIGIVDAQRAAQFTDVLLQGVSAHRAHTVILDITGVSVVDTPVAESLVRASQAVKLLGATAVLTGIRPEVAATLVEMGADLSRIVVHGSLQNGIAYALKRK